MLTAELVFVLNYRNISDDTKFGQEKILNFMLQKNKTQPAPKKILAQ